jgi:hypothetical protein
MRLFLALSLLATTLSAKNVFFDPPNPTSATPVVAHVTLTGCPPTKVTAERHGAIISITLDQPQCLVATPFDAAVDLGVVPAGVYDVVVSPPMLLLGLAEGTLIVRDATPPFEVVPNVVPLNGGEIHLRNPNGLYMCVITTPEPVCEQITVMIGGQPATIVRSTQTDIVVTAPPHAAGTVDVTLTRAAGTLTATAALDYFDFNKTPDLAFFEPVLFPAWVTGPGAFGSQWRTDVSMRNENDFPLPLTSTLFSIACFPICDTRPQAHSTVTISGANAPSGIVFWVPRQFAPKLFFDVLARDLSKQSEALGTEIPVAREHDVYDRPFSILLVPTDTKYRTTLRLFRIDGGDSVHVRIFPNEREDVLVDADVALTNGFAAIADLVAQYPQLAGKGPLRITVDGKTSQRVTYALVSVTNNDTQNVTVLAPH